MGQRRVHRVGTSRVSSIRRRWDLTQLLACGEAGWALATAAVGWHHCKCCLLQQQAWHTREWDRILQEESRRQTLRQPGQTTFLSRAICFLRNLAVRAIKALTASPNYTIFKSTTYYRQYSVQLLQYQSLLHLSIFSVWPTSLRWPGIKQLI